VSEIFPCPRCGTTAPLFYVATDYNKRISREGFRYYRCPADGYIFLQPIPSDLGKYYPESYYELPHTVEEHAAIAERLQQWKLDTVLEHAAPSGSLLEIGPAYGLFAFLAKHAGFDVTAIEMDPRSCTYLRDSVGINVVETSDTIGALDELPAFDVIAMWQAIEHIPDPWQTLEAVARKLKPGGVLVLDTPNPAAFQFAVLGKRWAHLDAPRHVTLIPAPLLASFMADHGMRQEYLSDTRAAGFNGFGWGYSFQNMIGNTPAGRFANIAGRALAKLLIPIERTGFRGATYVAVYRKLDPSA
jgi:SAM-dependent methyltransferase